MATRRYEQRLRAESAEATRRRILDAVYELSRERTGASSKLVFQEIADLRAKVERLKREAAAERIDQLRRDLELLKASDRSAFEERVRSLRLLLPD